MSLFAFSVWLIPQLFTVAVCCCGYVAVRAVARRYGMSFASVKRAVWCRHFHIWQPNPQRVGVISETSRCSSAWSRYFCRACRDSWPDPPKTGGGLGV